MWLFTKHGFFSVVLNKEGSKEGVFVVVRSREKRHLENLKKRFDLWSPIHAHAGTDYAYRIFLPRTTWEDIMARMAEEIDYTNFKDEALRLKTHVGMPYVQSLHEIWTMLLMKSRQWRGRRS